MSTWRGKGRWPWLWHTAISPAMVASSSVWVIEEVPFYDMHQTSLGGIYAAVAPAYNCLIRTSPYDPKGQEIMPELADTWEVSDSGKRSPSTSTRG